MINADQPAANLSTSNVVDCQVAAALVFVLEPAEAFGLAGFFVANEFEEDGLAVLGEDCDDVPFGEFVGEAAEVDVGGIAVVDVPGGVWSAERKRRSSVSKLVAEMRWSSWGSTHMPFSISFLFSAWIARI